MHAAAEVRSLWTPINFLPQLPPIMRVHFPLTPAPHVANGFEGIMQLCIKLECQGSFLMSSHYVRWHI